MTTPHSIGGRSTEELIVAQIDGDLADDDKKALRSHLNSCTGCAVIARQHTRLVERLAPSAVSTAAQELSLSRVREAANRETGLSWLGLALGTAAAAVLAILILTVPDAVGRFLVPERELIAERAETLGVMSAVMRVEDGRFAASAGQTIGVLVSSDLSLPTPMSGSVELRFAMPGAGYGVLATAPDLNGVRRVHLEGRIPTVDRATTIELWIHVDGPQSAESDHLTIRIEPTQGGQRARLP